MQRTLTLFELEADGLAAAELLDGEAGAGGGAPYWAFTTIGRNTAVKAIENFMVVGNVTEDILGLPRKS